jgi:hypothetical protein
MYGINETNPLIGRVDYDTFGEPVTLRELEAQGGKITRVRMLTEPGTPFLDVSYVHGELADGTPVQIIGLQVGTLRKGKGSVPYMSDMIAWAKAERVYGKRLGLLDTSRWSILS